MENKELIANFEKLAHEERRVTRAVLEHIAEILDRKAYLDLGYDGMYAYMTQKLGYSEAAAHRRISAAKVLQKQPAVAALVESGALNLTQLTDVAKLARQTKKEVPADLFQKLRNQPKAASEQILAEAFDIAPQRGATVKTQKDHSVRLEMTFTAEQFTALQKSRELLSHICPFGEWNEVLFELARRFNRKLEMPAVKPANSQLARVSASTPKAALTATSAPPVATPPAAKRGVRRRYIRLSVKREIFSRSAGQCEHFDPRTGRRCSSRYQPQIDHLDSLAKGGCDHPENLQLLCAVHNRAKGGD